MRVLVTGANGFLGGAITERLAARADLELVRSVRQAPAPPGAVAIDLADPAAISRALAEVQPDVVIHAAGRTSGTLACLGADNATATRCLAEAMAAATPAAGLILLGSAAQYGRSARRTPWRETDPCRPLGDYGGSKLAAETAALEVARQAGLPVAALRVFNVVAPSPRGQQVLASFLAKAATNPARVEMASLGAFRDFVALADVVTAVERVIERQAWGEAINVCTGTGRTTRSLLEAAAAEIGGVRVFEAAGAPVQLDWSVGDPTRCGELLGFVPSSDLGGLLRQAAAWVKGESDARSGA